MRPAPSCTRAPNGAARATTRTCGADAPVAIQVLSTTKVGSPPGVRCPRLARTNTLPWWSNPVCRRRSGVGPSIRSSASAGRAADAAPILQRAAAQCLEPIGFVERDAHRLHIAPQRRTYAAIFVATSPRCRAALIGRSDNGRPQPPFAELPRGSRRWSPGSRRVSAHPWSCPGAPRCLASRCSAACRGLGVRRRAARPVLDERAREPGQTCLRRARSALELLRRDRGRWPCRTS